MIASVESYQLRIVHRHVLIPFCAEFVETLSLGRVVDASIIGCEGGLRLVMSLLHVILETCPCCWFGLNHCLKLQGP